MLGFIVRKLTKLSDSRVSKARKAFLSGDFELHRRLHSDEEIGKEPWHKTEHGKYIGQAVYGASDGIVTTFAAISGIAGANLDPRVALIVGLANLFADGLSMAIGDYLSEKSERDYVESEKRRELWEIEHLPEAERREVREIFRRKGLSGEKLDSLVNILTSDKKIWLETMLREELGLFEDETSPLKSALVTFVSFVVAGFMPLLTYVLALGWPIFERHQFVLSCFVTAGTLFFVGALRQVVTGVKWFVGGLEMLAVGGLSALVAYIVGWLLKTVVGIPV